MSKAQELADRMHIYKAKPTTLESEAATLLRAQDALLRQALEALEKVYMECEVHSDDGETAMIKARNAIRQLEEHLK